MMQWNMGERLWELHWGMTAEQVCHVIGTDGVRNAGNILCATDTNCGDIVGVNAMIMLDCTEGTLREITVIFSGHMPQVQLLWDELSAEMQYRATYADENKWELPRTNVRRRPPIGMMGSDATASLCCLPSAAVQAEV